MRTQTRQEINYDQSGDLSVSCKALQAKQLRGNASFIFSLRNYLQISSTRVPLGTIPWRKIFEKLTCARLRIALS